MKKCQKKPNPQWIRIWIFIGNELCLKGWRTAYDAHVRDAPYQKNSIFSVQRLVICSLFIWLKLVLLVFKLNSSCRHHVVLAVFMMGKTSKTQVLAGKSSWFGWYLDPIGFSRKKKRKWRVKVLRKGADQSLIGD